MRKLIVFDLDGVLIDAKEIHYETLNQCLFEIDKKFVIKETVPNIPRAHNDGLRSPSKSLA